jgi:hypothetical protein
MQKMIYVLKLQQNRFFVHYSENKKEKELLRECEIYYDYVKKYKPISIIEIAKMNTFTDVDRIVRNYMYDHGYEYVRGGSYIEENLPNYLEKALNHEFNHIEINNENDNLIYDYLFHEILMKYEYKNYSSIDEIQQEIDHINQEFIKYKNEKKILEKTKYFIVNDTEKNMKNLFIQDIEWLYEICIHSLESNESNMMHYNFINTDEIGIVLNCCYVKKYKNLLIYLKQLYFLFTEYYLN